MKFLLPILRPIIRFFGNIKVYRGPLFLVLWSKGYQLKGYDIARVTDAGHEQIQKGDILLRGYNQYLTSLFIGKWSHVGIAIDSRTVIHAIGKGVVEESIFDFLKTDRIAIARPHLDDADLDKVVTEARTYLGADYDWIFDFDDARDVVCSELGYNAFKGFHDTLGMHREKKTVMPKAWLNYSGFDIIARYGDV